MFYIIICVLVFCIATLLVCNEGRLYLVPGFVTFQRDLYGAGNGVCGKKDFSGGVNLLLK